MHLSGIGDQSQAHFLFAVTLPSAQSKEKKLLQHCEYGCNIVSISWIKYQEQQVSWLLFLVTFVLTLVGWIYHS